MPSKLKLAAALFTVVLASCGGSGDDAPAPTPAPAPAPPPVADAAADCFNDSLTKPGVRYAATYRRNMDLVPGPPIDVRTITQVSSASFRGQGGLLLVNEMLDRPDLGYPSNSKIYVAYEGNVQLTYGGDIPPEPTTGQYFGDQRSYAFEPPLRDTRFGLRAGESVTLNENTTSPYYDGDGKLLGTNPVSPSTVKFVGKETITVPAGTFETCHFAGTGENSDTWYAKSLGLVIKSNAKPYLPQLVKLEMLPTP